MFTQPPTELRRIFGDQPRTLAEAKTIYLHPVLKSMAMYTQRNISGENAVWRRARDAVKRDMVIAIEHDREKERAALMSSALPSASKAKTPAPPPPKKKASAGGSFAARIASKRSASSETPDAATPSALTGKTAQEVAETELKKWDEMEEAEAVLMPTEGEQPINLPEYFLNMKMTKPDMQYLSLAALAAHGKTAAAAATERYFRGVSFVNSLARVGQPPETVALLSFLNRNAEHFPNAQAVLIKYKQRISERRAAMKSKREREDDDAEDDSATAACAADAEDGPMLTFEELIDGLEHGDVDLWLREGAAVDESAADGAAAATADGATSTDGAAAAEAIELEGLMDD